MIKFVPPSPDWITGILIISRAFYGVPPGIEDWSIQYWSTLCKQAKEIMEADAKRGF